VSAEFMAPLARATGVPPYVPALPKEGPRRLPWPNVRRQGKNHPDGGMVAAGRRARQMRPRDGEPVTSRALRLRPSRALGCALKGKHSMRTLRRRQYGTPGATARDGRVDLSRWPSVSPLPQHVASHRSAVSAPPGGYAPAGSTRCLRPAARLGAGYVPVWCWGRPGSRMTP
jgi:hypothetical protein